MKVIQVPFCFYPDSVGGTEVYVESLATHLHQLGVDIVIAAPADHSSSYEYRALAVRRFAIPGNVDDIRELYGEGNIAASREFGDILDEEQPEIVHLHAFTRGASLRSVREAKRRGIKVVFTYHTPTVSCQRGTLLRWGSEVCDGKLDLHTCSACALHSHGLGRAPALALSRVPKVIGQMAGAVGLSGGGWTALRMTELVDLRHSAFRALMREVDQVVALCQWVKDLLSRNGVPAEKIVVSRHGLPHRAEASDAEDMPVADRPLRIAFLGRLDHTKGADILIRALQSLPGAAVELHLYGIVQSTAGTQYLEQLKRLAGNDLRISFLPPVPSDRIVSLLRSYHLLAVPSRWLETGPLVVLESFAAGTPVIGSNLGGVAELVEHEVNGLLIETDSVEGWSQAIQRCCEDKTLQGMLRRGICPPRGVAVVAQEMRLLYEKTLDGTLVHQIPSYLVERAEVHS